MYIYVYIYARARVVVVRLSVCLLLLSFLFARKTLLWSKKIVKVAFVVLKEMIFIQSLLFQNHHPPT